MVFPPKSSHAAHQLYNGRVQKFVVHYARQLAMILARQNLKAGSANDLSNIVRAPELVDLPSNRLPLISLDEPSTLITSSRE